MSRVKDLAKAFSTGNTSPVQPTKPLTPTRTPTRTAPVTPITPITNPKAASSDLDLLLSPVQPTAPPDFGAPVSSDSDTQEVTLDDSRFSTVLLSAPSPETPPPTNTGTNGVKQPPTEETQPPPAPQSDTMSSSGSILTISTALTSPIDPGPTSAKVDFILARLDHQAPKNNRASLQGTQLLREEFNNARLQGISESEEDDPEARIDWDFWGEVMNDYEGVARSQPQRLAHAIEVGIPSALRGMVWQLMSASKDPQLEATYARLLKESTPHEKSIQRDLGRTFPHHAFFKDGHGIGQESLFNVLKAYSLYDPECGYCQGLPFIVAPLLLVAPDEEAFCLLVRIMHSYELRAQFLPEMPGLQLRLFQFDRLIEEMLPVLHLHFIRQGVKSSMFCSQWFLTLFAYRFPLDVVFRIFDHILATGIESIFGFSIILLQKNEAHLLQLSFDKILDFLKVSVLDYYKTTGPGPNGEETYRVDDLVQDASQLKITPFQLDAYAGEFAELVRARNAHMIEMDNLRNQNRQLSNQVKALETALAQINSEHCEVIKELVMAKLEKEEMEGELVKYKLLYAEVMHRSEDAMSSHRLSARHAS